MSQPRRPLDHLSRRTALTGAASAGIGVPLLAACGSSDSTDGAADTGSTAGAEGDSGSSASGGALASTADIEVGGGTIFADQEVVVVQPTAGDYKGYTAVCPHQGCLVASISSEGIECPCHGSVFSLEDGSPLSGPADEPLAEVALSVTGEEITLA